MIEPLLFSLIVGLFIYEVVVLRILMKRQINKTLKHLVDDWNPQTSSVKVVPVQQTHSSYYNNLPNLERIKK